MLPPQICLHTPIVHPKIFQKRIIDQQFIDSLLDTRPAHNFFLSSLYDTMIVYPYCLCGQDCHRCLFHPFSTNRNHSKFHVSKSDSYFAVFWFDCIAFPVLHVSMRAPIPGSPVNIETWWNENDDIVRGGCVIFASLHLLIFFKMLLTGQSNEKNRKILKE